MQCISVCVSIYSTNLYLCFLRHIYVFVFLFTAHFCICVFIAHFCICVLLIEPSCICVFLQHISVFVFFTQVAPGESDTLHGGFAVISECVDEKQHCNICNDNDKVEKAIYIQYVQIIYYCGILSQHIYVFGYVCFVLIINAFNY